MIFHIILHYRVNVKIKCKELMYKIIVIFKMYVIL
nr:MAG TPA: hypothetical protein [Bacteriophage sp.]